MRCGQCGAELPKGHRFCMECGARIPAPACPGCGQPNPPTAKFCGSCGAGLGADGKRGSPGSVPPPAAALAPLAERRLLTLLFCDLVGSTAMSGQLDPEDLRVVIGAYHRRCAEVSERMGGFVARAVGDGVLVYFGFPQAHEDDAERAVRCGLAMLEAVGRLETIDGAPLTARIGIATGMVVVGDFGFGAAREQEAVGETPNLAARLQSLAEPGTVLIAASTRRLIGGLFDYRDLGHIALKGFRAPVHAWQVLGLSTVESRFKALRSAQTPLVGRAEELELLLRRWTEARRGEGRVVLLCGEPGIGKSRLIATLHDRLRADSHTNLHYFCSPHHTDTILFPLVAQLERAAGFAREDTPEQKFAKLKSLLLQGAAKPQQIALIADLLGLPSGASHGAAEISPRRRKERTLAALVAQLEGIATRQPVLIVFEDVHWMDPTSRELLELLIDRVQGLPVLLIVSFRPEFVAPWIGRPPVSLHVLNRLDRREIAAMIERTAGGKSLPREVIDTIIDRTDGVPLFIEELTKTVLEGDLLREEEDRFVPAGPQPALAIPSSLHASLMARLDRLGVAKEVAQVAAAIGRQSSYELIAAATALPEPQLREALEQLVAADLISRRGVAPDAEYTFKHALVQDAAYATLLRSRRVQLHGRICATLEKRFPEVVAAQPARLAQHCAEAGLTEKAIGYWLTAGRQALERAAFSEAIAQVNKGLDLLPGLPDGPVRQQHELRLQLVLGAAYTATKGHAAPIIGEIYERARQVCNLLGDPPQLVPVLLGQWIHRVMRGELRLARRLSEELLERGKTRNDAGARVTGFYASGMTLTCLGEFVPARGYLEQVLELYDPAHRRSVLDERVAALSNLFCLMSALGYPEQGRVIRDEALAEAKRISYPFPRADALLWSLLGDWGVEEQSVMLRRADELLALAAEHGLFFFTTAGTIFRGWSLALLGREAEGIALLEGAAAACRETESLLLLPCALTLLADALGHAAHPDQGLKRLAEAARLAESTQVHWVEPEIHRLRGELCATLGRQDAAAAGFRDAIASAQRQSAKLWELRATTSFARLYHGQDKTAEAREMLTPIYGWFSEGHALPDLKAARALLEELR